MTPSPFTPLYARSGWRRRAATIIALAWATASGAGAVLEDFSSDPRWEGRNNLPTSDAGVDKTQDFGWTDTHYAGGAAEGEIGGTVWRSLQPSYYALPIGPKTLDDTLHASGSFAVTHSEGGSGLLIGWFNSASRGWRTPNSLAFRIDGESNAYRVFFEYGTRHWKTGGGQTFEGPYQTTTTPMPKADGARHTWELTYDPEGSEGRGEIVFVLDGIAYRAALEPGHKEDGAVFDCFGMFNQQIAGDRMTVYLDDVRVDGASYGFDADPGWEGVNNRMAFRDTARRPIHNFGYRSSNIAGGEPGEIGGLVWRIESTRPQDSAYYATPIETINLNRRLHARGKVAMTVGAADSAVLIGWFNSYTFIGAPPMNFLGIMVEGPSRIGHYFRPAYSSSDGIGGVLGDGPLIRPDGASHGWSFEYNPEAGAGQIAVTLDDETVTMDLTPAVRKGGAAFDRFGILTWERGGNCIEIYFDNLEFTGEPKQDARP